MSKLTRKDVINRADSVSFLSGVKIKVEWNSGSCWLKGPEQNTILCGTTREVYDSLYAIQEFLFVLKSIGV